MVTHNRLKQRPEASHAERTEVVLLYDLDEHGRSVHEVLREQLQQVPALVEVDQDVQAPEYPEVLVETHPHRLEGLPHGVVVRSGHLDELNAAGLEAGNGLDDVCAAEGDVLDARAVVEGDIFFDLGLLFALSGLVNGHFNAFVGGGHDNRFEG